MLVAAQRLQRNLVLAEVHAVEDVQEKKEMNGYTVATFSKTELNLCASMITAAKEDFIALQKKTTGPLQSSSKTSDRFRGVLDVAYYLSINTAACFSFPPYS